MNILKGIGRALGKLALAALALFAGAYIAMIAEAFRDHKPGGAPERATEVPRAETTQQPPTDPPPRQPEITRMTRDTVGGKWPLTVDAASVGCDGWNEAWVLPEGGGKFGANAAGSAKYGHIRDTPWPRIDTATSEMAGRTVHYVLGPLTVAAIAHCGFSKQK